jgi:hypothetical protein
MLRMILGILFVAFCPLVTRAALDPQTDKPYQLKVVLRIAENRLLTPVFRDRVERQLRDSLQNALGDLARVEIVHEHPLLKEVETKGLELALDDYAVLSDTKTHFVLIDFANGRYEIQARQHDGFTGLSSPVVRHSSTADRELVARRAALLIDQDFGLAGTLNAVRAKEDKVAVLLKGGKLGVALDHWVKKDQVFAVAQILQTGTQSFRMPWTLLQVLEEPKGEVCQCRLLYQYKDPLPVSAGVLGYRCLKLGTTRAPLRLRVVTNDKLRIPLSARNVRINAREFDSRQSLDHMTTTSDGLVQSGHSYENVAFVSVFASGGILLARIPVEIIDGLTVTCPVGAGGEAETKGQLYQRRERWLRRLNDDVGVAESIVGELNAMRGRSSAEALARAQEGLRALQTDVSSLTAESASLRADWARDLPQADPLNLKEGEERLHYVQDRRDELQRHIAALQAIITEETDPKRREWRDMVTRADLLEKEAEFDKAIELYQRVLQDADAKNVPKVAKKLEKLQTHWALKDEAHRKARAFIYDVWPKQETATQIKTQLDEARKAFLTCKEAGDILTPQKLLKTHVVLSNHLIKEADSLQPDAREDDLRRAKTIIALTDDLHKFNEEINDYLANAKAAGE